MKKLRLYAGTINARPDDDEFRNFTLDVSSRGIWDRDLNMSVLPDFVASLADLGDFREETFDEIVCHHVLEHLSLAENEAAIEGLFRILKPGGVLDVEVPDVERVAAGILSGELSSAEYNQWLLGEQLVNHEPGDSHRFMFSEAILRALLVFYGFVVGEREETGLALRFLATKG